MDQLLAIIPSDYLAYITAFVTIVAALMTVLPKPSEEASVYGYIYKALSLVAFNFGKSKNV